MSSTALTRLEAKRNKIKEGAGAVQTASAQTTKSTDTNKKNNGSALAYLGEKLAVGTVRSFEGITDFLVGGVAEIVGADDFAKKLYANDWFGNWYSHPDEWYNPGEGMKFAGAVLEGIGTSAPAIAASVGATLVTGGAALPAIAAGFAGGLSAGGGALSEAYKETGELNSKTYGYALQTGVTEGVLEGITGGFGTGAAKLGKSIATRLGKEATEKVAKSGAKKVILELGKEFASEGFEEGMSAILDPVYRRSTIDPNAQNATVSEILYDATVGGFSGMLMGGASGFITSGKKLSLGNKIVNNGEANGVIEAAEKIADYENKNNSEDETFTAIRDTLTDLKKSLEGTNGEFKTAKQKRMLAELQINTSFAVFSPVIKNSALRAVHNADAVAERFNAYGFTDANGNPITITAEQIREGVDLSSQKSIRKALKNNNALRTIAVMDATGQLVMNQGAFAEATLEGKNYATQDDLNTFAKEADPETFKKVSEALNITEEEWRTMTPKLFTEKMSVYESTDEGKANIERAKLVKEAKSIPESEAKEKLPTSPRTQKNGSIKRYKTANADIAIIKDDGKYTIFNYQSRKATRALALSETISELEKLKGESQNTAQAENVDRKMQFNGLEEYSAFRKELLQRDENNIIAKNDEDVLMFISEAFSHPNSKKRLHLGAISKNTIQKIYDEIPNLPEQLKDRLFAENREYSLEISQDDIRHFVDEKKGMTEKDIFDYISKLPEIVKDFDSVHYAVYQKGKNKQNGLLLKKQFSDGKYIALELISKKNSELQTHNIYMDSSDYVAKKKAIQTMSVQKAQDLTSETLVDSPSDISIPEKSQKINPSDEKISKTESKNEKPKETTLSREYRESEAFAEKNIPEYNKLYEPTKRAIQRTIVEARSNGLAESDIATFAKFSAKSGINVAFDKKNLISGIDENGNYTYADGLFDGDNTIYINKDSKRRYSSVIFHELMHALVKNTATKSEFRLGKSLLRTAAKKMDSERRSKIEKAYKKYYKSLGTDLSSVELADEILAHYTEDVMGDIDVLEFLEGEVPGLGKRIIGFFNESARTHAGDENLSREARKYARKFRELYRQIEQRHKGMNATEGVKSGERMALPDSVEKDVVSKYGTTYKWSETGYILKDGKRVDLSGKSVGAPGGYRALDHRDVFDIYEVDSYTDAMIEFMARGNIRVAPESPGINLIIEPTDTQYEQITSLVERLGWKNKEFHVDFDNKNGKTVDSLHYEGNVSARKIVADIKHYFKEGKIPYQSELSNFRFALDYESDIDALDNGTFDVRNNTHLRVLEHTPKIFIEKAGAKDRPIVMSWDVAFLAMKNKKETAQWYRNISRDYNEALDKGHYHNLGSDALKSIPQSLRDPLYIVKQDNGRLCAITEILHKGKRPVFAVVELEAYTITTEKGEKGSDIYNLIVTISDGQPNYIENTILSKNILYNKNKEEPAHFISRLKSLKKLMPKNVLADSSNPIIPNSEQKINTFPKKSSEKNSNERYALDIDTETDAEEIPNTLDSVAKERETYSPGFWKKLFSKKDRLYIETVDELFGMQKYLEKVGKRTDAAAIVNMARSSREQAQTMIGSVQYDLFSGNYEELGEGIQEILAPITKVNKAKGETHDARALRVKKFNDYMLHQMNIDRMTLEERSMKWHEEDVNALAELNEKLLKAEKAYAEAKEQLDKLKGVETNEALLERKKLRDRMSKEKGYTKHLKKQIKPLKAKVDSFVPLKNKPVFGENQTRKNAVTAEQSRRIVEKYEKENPEFKEIAEKVYGYLRNNQKMRVEAGLITQEAADYMEKLYPHYVPTYRDTSYSGAAAVTGAGNIAVSSTVKRSKGSGQNILELQNSIAEQTNQLIKAANINRIATAIYEAAVESGDTEYVEIISKEKVDKQGAADSQMEATEIIPKNNQVTFFYKGEKITMRVTKDIFIGFEGLYKPTVEYDSVVLGTLSKLNKAYKAMVTSYSPAFLVRNPIRDIQDAGLNSKHAKLFVKNLPLAWKDIFNNSDDWKLYRAMGGFSSTVFSIDGLQNRVGERGFTEIASLFDSENDRKNVKKIWSGASSAFKAAFQTIENLNAVIEQATRFAEFKASLEAGDNAQVALYNSAEVTTNFGRRGRITKTLNATIMPFLNPAIQGFDKMFRNVTDAFKKGEWDLIAKAFAKLLVKAFIVGMAPQILNALMYSNDEDYKDLRETDKENNFLIKVGNQFIKIPRGRVASVIGGALNRLIRMTQGKDADIKGYFENVVSQVTPAENISRTIFSPWNDIRTNTTWYGTDIEGKEFDAVEPRDRYDESTSKIAVFIGQTINYSPKKIHYLLDQYSGVIGDIALPATTPKAGNPLLSYKSNFLLDPKTSNKISSDFYKLYDEVQYAKSAYDTAKESGTAKEGEDAAVYQLKYLNRVKSAVSKLYDQKRAIQGSTELSAVDKLQQARAVQILINEAQKNALTDFAEMKHAIDITSTLSDDVRFTEATRIVYGAESALESYDEKVYEKATMLSTAGLDYENFYYYYFSTRGIESDKDAKGNAVPGSKRKKVVSAILEMGLDKEQTLLLIASSGYSIKDGDIRGMSATAAKRLLAKYISNQKLTKEQKTKLAEACGFTVKNGKIVLKS